MLRALLPAGAVLYAAALLFAGRPPLSGAVWLPPLVSLLSFVPFPGGAAALLRRFAALGDRFFPPLLVAAAAALTIWYGTIWRTKGADFHPVVHDEWAYLFQAETFASGRLSWPSPPEPIFFDALHILTEPVFAAKYPPGHALWLAPWVLAGIPWMGVLLAAFLALFLIGLVARSYAGAWGALLLVVLFGLSPAAMKTAPTYLSQPTFLLGTMLFVFLMIRWASGRAARFCGGTAGLVGGWLLWTRPLNGLVLLAAAAGAVVLLRLLRYRLSLRYGSRLFLIFLAAVCALGLGYNRAITGSFLTMPWQLYSELYTPEDHLGFYRGEPLEPRELGPGKQMSREQFLAPNWRRYTPGFALRTLFSYRIPYVFLESAPYALLILLTPLLAGGKRRLVAGIALLHVFLLHGAYLFYWSPWPKYSYEISPLLLFVPILGAATAASSAMRRREGGVVLATAGLLVLALLGNVDRLPMQLRFIESKPLHHARFDRAMEAQTEPPALVFVRYGRRHNSELDLINNSPDLAHADRIYVHDRGAAENRRFHRSCFPDRTPYYYVEMSGRVFPGYERPAPTESATPAD